MASDQDTSKAPVTTGRGERMPMLLAGVAGLAIGYGIEVAGATRLALRHELTRSALAPGALVAIVLGLAALGALGGGWLADRAGRRSAMLGTAAVGMVGAVLATAAPSAVVIDVGRGVVAVAVGSLTAVAAVTVAEMVEPRTRGAVVILVPLGAVIGLAAAFVADLLLADSSAWRVLFGSLVAIFVALFVVTRMVAAPVSPPSEVGADRSLARPTVRALVIPAVVLAVGQQLTGIDVIVGRARSLFGAISITPDSANVWAAVSIGFFSVMAILLARHHIDHDGRRQLLRIGLLALIGSLLVLRLLSLLSTAARGEFVDYAAIPVMWVAVFAFALSLGSTGWVVISEILPRPVRGTASGVAYALRWLAALVVALTAGPLADAFGDGVLFLLSAIASVAVYVVVRRIPETMDTELFAVGPGDGTETGEAVEAPRSATRPDGLGRAPRSADPSNS